jgi:hypothetical protein
MSLFQTKKHKHRIAIIHLLIRSILPSFYKDLAVSHILHCIEEWLATNPDGKQPTNQKTEG